MPTFSEHTDTVSAVIGTDIILRCDAFGQPTPLIEWMHKGRLLQTRNHIAVQAGSLSINGISLQDAGRYDCIAENVLGRATKSIYVQVQGR